MAFLDRLRAADPLISVELRPPRSRLGHASSLDAWLDLRSAVVGLTDQDTALFFTDNAVGAEEEENLHHLVSNLEEYLSHIPICPFLTTKHTLEYCLWFADRAVADEHGALTVLGGDRHVGSPRCVPHAKDLRRLIRERHPSLPLGGWANPYRDPVEQAGYLAADDATLDFYLTQIVSHYDLDPVKRFLAEANRRCPDVPAVFGVFYYRSANRKTLRMLSRFMRVPEQELVRDLNEWGVEADEVCARTIRGLRRLGVRRVYVSNLSPHDARERLASIRERADAAA